MFETILSLGIIKTNSSLNIN